MANNIASSKGRLLLMGVILICLVASIVSLFTVAKGGAIGSNNLLSAVIKFLGFYVPLLSLVATFFFTGRQGGRDKKSPAVTFYFAMFIVSLWVLTPILLLFSGMYIEEVLDYIDKLIPLGQSLALMALGYYFTKST